KNPVEDIGLTQPIPLDCLGLAQGGLACLAEGGEQAVPMAPGGPLQLNNGTEEFISNQLESVPVGQSQQGQFAEVRLEPPQRPADQGFGWEPGLEQVAKKLDQHGNTLQRRSPARRGK